MKAIRGATTVSADNAAEIKESIKELLETICKQNKLSLDSIICILFSNTDDIKSFYPAKAAREAGFYSCALYSSLEPQIEGSLKKCIRVMVLAESDSAPKHVYLRGAIVLRQDLSGNLNIAVDGPAGSGKSTIAKILAKQFNILYLDTGAMYRAVAYACMKDNVDCHNEKDVEKILPTLDISVKYEDGMQKTLLSGEDVSDKIRTPEISLSASTVSAHGAVRTKMVDLQRKIAALNSCILDGRDIGSNVLPNAKFKFYLTATPEIRAERRLTENKIRGFNQTYEEVLCEIIARDEQDKNRKIAPLIKAKDAIEVDTSYLTVEEVARLITNKIQEKI